MHGGLEVGRERRFEGHDLASARMGEGKLPGVEHLAGVVAGAFAAVQFIAQNGMAEVMEMDPNLVGAAAVQSAFHETNLSVRPDSGCGRPKTGEWRPDSGGRRGKK
jgi:hypothetical protein